MEDSKVFVSPIFQDDKARDRLSFIFYIVVSIQILATVWGCGGTWREFSILIYSTFFVGALIILGFFAKYATSEYVISYKGDARLLLFCFLFTLEAFLQLFLYDSQLIQEENYLRILRRELPKFLPSSVDSEYQLGGAYPAFASIFSAASAFAISILAQKLDISKVLLKILSINIVLMALFGIVQKFLSEYMIYGLFYSDSMKYGTIFISNASGAAINLGLSGILGLLLLEWNDRFKFIRRCFYLICAAICLYAVYDTKSVGAVAISCIQILIFICVCLCGKSLKAWLLMAIVIALGVAAASGYRDHFLPEDTAVAQKSFSSRMLYNKVSMPLFDPTKIWGIGGGNYEYKVGVKLIELSGSDAFRSPRIIRHAHNDPLEYIFEYGIIGCIIFLGFFVEYNIRVFHLIKKHFTKSNVILLSGVMLCGLHSFLDLHLHVMSVLIIFAFYLAIAISNFKRNSI